MPKNSLHDYAVALYDATKEASEADIKSAVNAFVELLYKNQSLRQAPRIIEEFEKYAKKKAGIISLNITAAHDPKPETIEAIKKAFGKNVEAIIKIDKSIIGGVVIREENTILDASVKNQLQQLKQELI
jgi:F-type H+-transporting ATPase subunit delta